MVPQAHQELLLLSAEQEVTLEYHPRVSPNQKINQNKIKWFFFLGGGNFLYMRFSVVHMTVYRRPWIQFMALSKKI